MQFEASYHDSPKIIMQSMLDSRRFGGMPQNLKIVCSEIESECSYNYHVNVLILIIYCFWNEITIPKCEVIT